jgi:NTP pyrophosphatase (non-canonical NTP hydrolase)
MKDSKYLKEVIRTQNEDADCWEHYVLGICDEAGEIAKLFKRHQQRLWEPVNPGELAEELGDLLWFVFSLANHYGLKIGNIKKINVKKLRQRYKKAVYTAEEDFERNVELEQKLLDEVMANIEKAG